MQPKYIRPKSKYIRIKRQIGNKKLTHLKRLVGEKQLTYANIVNGDNKTRYFWKYYKHYHNLNISKEQMKEHKKIYNETRKNLENKPIDIFNEFIDAWIEDDEFEESTLGPDFSMKICKYFKTCDDDGPVPSDWFIEAAIRDMIYDLFNYYDDENFNKLKKILKNNNWIQTNVIKSY